MPSPQSTTPALSHGPLRLFTLLEARAGEVVTYDEALQVIGSRAADFRKVVHVWIVSIRDRLPRGCEIEAVRGQGYKLIRRLAA